MDNPQISLCNSCKREWHFPSCGAGVRDYDAKKGVGVISCKKYEKSPESTEQAQAE